MINKGEKPEKRSCGNCKYHQHEDITDGFVCVNPASANCTDWTEHNDCCSKWERRKKDDISRS